MSFRTSRTTKRGYEFILIILKNMSLFWDLVNIEEFDKRDYFPEERWEVAFYCKDCKKIVETDRPDKNGYVFICKNCEGKNIAIWTEAGLKSNYKL